MSSLDACISPASRLPCRVYIPAIYAVNKIDQITLVRTVTRRPTSQTLARVQKGLLVC